MPAPSELVARALVVIRGLRRLDVVRFAIFGAAALFLRRKRLVGGVRPPHVARVLDQVMLGQLEALGLALSRLRQRALGLIGDLVGAAGAADSPRLGGRGLLLVVHEFLVRMLAFVLHGFPSVTHSSRWETAYPSLG